MFDVAIIGGGLVGLASARALLLARSDAKVVLLEKEPQVARHQSGRNSGVLHSGVYYAPGSAKARLCREGRAAMLEYCREHGIAHRVCGKLVVAVDESELPRLDALETRGRENGVDLVRIDGRGLREIEPHAAGITALHVRDTGVVDFQAVARSLAREIHALGGEVRLGAAVTGFRAIPEGTELTTTSGPLAARLVIACAGLHADRVARSLDCASDVAIVPFRGEYAAVRSERAHLVRGSIYPVPDPRFPFLGVHLTRGVDGVVHAGPNAVLALAREGYSRGDVSLRDTLETLGHRGFRRFARRHLCYGVREWIRARSRAAFARAAARLVPELMADDLVDAPSGVRAQAVSQDGDLVDDFAIVHAERAIHVLNAPSPAATACLAIGRELAARALDR